MENLVAHSSKSGVMIRTLLQEYHQIGLTSAGLVIFFTVFISVLIQVFRKRHHAYFEKMRQLPLD